MKLTSMLVAAVFASTLSAAPRAQEITIGSQGDPTLDPHFLYIGTNVGFWRHFYGALTFYDAAGRAVPSLAESFKPVDGTTWEFRLRPDIRFRDGTTMTADDVVYSLNRLKNLPGNPSSYAVRLESVVGIEAVDPLTVRIRTSLPNPYVPENLTDAAIVSRRAVEGKTTGDFATLKANDEYGPYRILSFTPGDRLVLERNDSYWGEKPYWQKVTFRVLQNDAARVTALLSGGVDFIDFVPPTDIPKLRADPKFAVQDGPSGRMMVLLVNFRPGPIGGVTDAAGKPLAKNPLLDLRVRQAMSQAIDRRALTERIMDGAGLPSSTLTLPGMEGHNPAAPLERFDPARSKALLAEAGFPSGFGITVSCTAKRYPNDDKICQSVGQMLARAGFQAKVETMPLGQLMPKLRGTATEGDVGLGMLGLGMVNRPVILPLMIHSVDAAVGRGQYNFGQYSNPDLDRKIDDAFMILDLPAREAAIRGAVEMATADIPVLPLFFQKVVTASRAGLGFTTSLTEETLAWRILPTR